MMCYILTCLSIQVRIRNIKQTSQIMIKPNWINVHFSVLFSLPQFPFLTARWREEHNFVVEINKCRK